MSFGEKIKEIDEEKQLTAQIKPSKEKMIIAQIKPSREEMINKLCKKIVPITHLAKLE
jgi:hypothetical protein